MKERERRTREKRRLRGPALRWYGAPEVDQTVSYQIWENIVPIVSAPNACGRFPIRCSIWKTECLKLGSQIDAKFLSFRLGDFIS